ncbi:MAG: DUF58 domain-containing protein [Planctomycetota bacterium]|jgi:uncharacterized protein (DUF58 family)
MNKFESDFLQKLEYLALVAKRVFRGRIKAERRSRGYGSSVEFADYRDYSAGDDYRYLDWNVYARLDELLIKLFEEEQDLHVYILLDVSHSMAVTEEKYHCALRVAASLSYIAMSNLDRVAVHPFADRPLPEFPMTRGKGKILSLLEYLEHLTPVATDTNLEQVTRVLMQRRSQRGLILLISDLYDPRGFEKGLDALRYRGDEIQVIHLIEPGEGNPSLLGDLDLVDCETSAVRSLTINERHLRTYKRVFQAFLRRAEGACRQREVGYIRSTTDVPFEDLVLRVLRHGGAVA